MSGGVDSSVAALLLAQQGFAVQGVTLQVWEHEDETVAASKRWEERGCCKVGIARYVAQKLSIPHELIDSRIRFREAVIDDFVSGYSSGTTPNPCVRCNERVKLRQLIELADERQIPFVATGHYAQTAIHLGQTILTKATDERKDQTYFLYRIQNSWLPRLLFPVGGMTKSDVWSAAEELGLPATEMKESQEICFVSHGDYRTFIQSELPSAKQPGAIVDREGNHLGTHQGVAFYTPGQRRGLGVAGGQRLYVTEVRPEANTVVLGTNDELFTTSCELTDLNILDSALLDPTISIEAKVRYASPASPTIVKSLAPNRLSLHFQQPQRALSPGQSAVLYAGKQVLGGGIIQSA